MKSGDSRAIDLTRLTAAVLIIAALLWPISTPTVSAASSLHWLYASGSATGGKRISLRVVLTEPAPPGGAVVALTSSSPLIPVPASVTVSSGETERRIGVTTVPTDNDTNVTVTASYGGVSRSKVILIKEPYLSSLSVQSRIRAGGSGKIIVRLSGRAPSAGIVVFTKSNRPSVLPMPETATIAPGSASVTLIVPAADVHSDVFVNVIARYDGIRLVESTIVRDYFDTEATATVVAGQTATAVANETATTIANQTATAVTNETATAIANSTATSGANETATAIANQTASAVANETATAAANQTATAAANQTATAIANQTATAIANHTATAIANQTATAAANGTATAAANQTATAAAPTPTTIATATATATAVPPQFSLEVSPNPVVVGQGSLLTVCWTNATSGGTLGPVFAGASTNSDGNPIPSANLDPDFNDAVTWNFTDLDTCESTQVTGVQAGSASWAMEIGASKFVYLGPITIVDAPTPTPTVTNTAEPTPTNTPEPTATNTTEPTATSTPEPTPTDTPEPTATNTPDPTATSTPEPTATNTPEPTATSTAEPTATSTPEPTATSTPELTATNTPDPTPTNTSEPTPTNSPEPTATNTPAPTATNTPEPTATNTPEPTPTNTPDPTATNTAEPTATNTPEPTATNTPEPTATNTPEPTATSTLEPTATNTPEPTATNTPEPTPTNTPEPTGTNTPEPTATNTPEPTVTNTPEPTPTNTPEPTPTDTPGPTATPAPPTFSFVIADNNLIVGDQTSVEICWTNPTAGPGITGPYTYASGSAGPSATFTGVLSPNWGSPISVSFTAESPCVDPVFTAMTAGRAWVTLEYGFPDTKFVFSEPIDVFASLTQLPSVPGKLLRLSSAGFRELE